MTSARTAAIVGAGISGFTAAAALAQRGWEVTLYERNDNAREFGAGIYLKDNSLPVLDRLGIGDQIMAAGERIRSARIIDERQRVIVERDVSRERLVVVLRSDLHNAVRDAALKAGASLVTGRQVIGAQPDGSVLFSDGGSLRAGLVLGADGIRSRVRESLGLTQSYRAMPDGATRLLIPRQEDETSSEYWSGSRRVGVAPCSPDQTYVFMIGPESHRRCGALPIDRDYWQEAFPHLASLFDRISDHAGLHHRHEEVVCTRWTAGRVGLIGDAAHAQPPNLGQGAGLAIAAAWELARTVSESENVACELIDWERRVRPGVDRVQRLTTLYSQVGYYWPGPALAARAQLFHWLSAVPATARTWEFWWRGGTNAPAAGLGSAGAGESA